MAREAAVGAGDGITAPKEIAAILESGEKLLWFSAPGAFQIAMTKLKSVVMSIPFFGIAAFWFNSFMKAADPGYMGIIGWVFIAFGVYHIVIPAWGFFVSRFFTMYAITDKRVMIIQIYPRHKLQAEDLKGVIGVTRVDHDGEKGTLHILKPVLGDKNKTKEGDFAEVGMTLLGINHAQRIEGALNQLREAQQGEVPQRKAPGT